MSFAERYELLHRVHAGTYFEAYQAKDKLLERRVFIKASRASDDALAAKVVEAHVRHWRALAGEHFNGVPAIFEISRSEDRWFLITEWIEGVSLRELLDGRGPIIRRPEDFLRTLLGRCISILGDLHARGFAHADISPGNILLDTRLAITLVDPAPPLNLSDPRDPTRGLILGTSDYLAPEILAGHPATLQSDLFALGKVAMAVTAHFELPVPAFVQRLTEAHSDARPASVEEALILVASDFGAGERTVNPPQQNVGSSARSSGRQESTSQAPSAPPPSRRQALTEVHAVPRRPKGLIDRFLNALRQRPEQRRREQRRPDNPDRLEVSALTSVPLPTRQSADHADFSVMAPKLIQPDRHFVIEVWVAPTEQREIMLEQATRSGRMIERAGRSSINIDRDALITVILKLPDFEVDHPVETLGWNGDIRNVGFIVKAPASLAPGVYPGVAKLLQNQIPFASIVFDLEVAAFEQPVEGLKPLSAHVQRIARAFASYASVDRSEVLRRVQGIQALGTNVFLDIVNLRSGHHWESTLYREIEASDCFFLFWSRNASKSKWVEREWRYALKLRGLDFINPLPLEDPRGIPPPTELSSKHFNDMLLAFIKAEEVYKSGG
jgi:serine/threonine protein kinase